MQAGLRRHPPEGPRFGPVGGGRHRVFGQAEKTAVDGSFGFHGVEVEEICQGVRSAGDRAGQIPGETAKIVGRGGDPAQRLIRALEGRAQGPKAFAATCCSLSSSARAAPPAEIAASVSAMARRKTCALPETRAEDGQILGSGSSVMAALAGIRDAGADRRLLLHVDGEGR